jgi:hypothetical protein
MTKPLPLPVGDSPRRPQRNPAALDRFPQVLLPSHVQERLLLTGEARLWQVLGRRRRTHRHGRPVSGQAGVSFGDGFTDVLGHAPPKEQFLDLIRGALQGVGVRSFDLLESGQDTALQVVRGNEPLVGDGGQVETTGYGHALAKQPGERDSLATHGL